MCVSGLKPYGCLICSRPFPRLNNLRSHITKMHNILEFEADKYIERLSHKDGGDAEDDTSSTKELMKSSIKSETDVSHHGDDTSKRMKQTAQDLPKAAESNGSTSTGTVDTVDNSPKKQMKPDTVENNDDDPAVEVKCPLCSNWISMKVRLLNHLENGHFVIKDCVSKILDLIDTSTDVRQPGEGEDLSNVDEKQYVAEQQFEVFKALHKSILQQINHSKMQHDLFEDSHNNKDFKDPEIGDVEDSHSSFSEVSDDLPYEIINADKRDERQFRCKLCGFRCDRRYYMTTYHMNKHTGAKPFVCVICSAGYTRKYVLQRHVIKEHKLHGQELAQILEASDLNSTRDISLDTSKGQETELDDSCSFDVSKSLDTFASNSMGDVDSEDRKDRFKSGHSDISTQDMEDEDTMNAMLQDESLSYSTLRMFKNGIMQPTYKCNLCSFTCTRKWYLLKVHIPKHTGQTKAFDCPICGTVYSRKYDVRKHIAKKHKILGEALDTILAGIKERTRHYDSMSMTIKNQGSQNVAASQVLLSEHGEDMSDSAECDTNKGNSTGLERRTLNDSVFPRNESMFSSFSGQFSDSNKDTDKDNSAIEREMSGKIKLENIDSEGEMPGKIKHENTDSEREMSGKIKRENIDSERKMSGKIKRENIDSDETGNMFENSGSSNHYQPPHKRIRRSDTLFSSYGQTPGYSYQTTSITSSMKSNTTHDFVKEEASFSSNAEDIHEHDDSSPEKDMNQSTSSLPLSELVKADIDKDSLTCLRCGKGCSTYGNLKQHVKLVHYNLKEYVCTYCEKSFNTRYNLKTHLKMHLNGEDRKRLTVHCDVCGKVFSNASYLKVHTQQQHGISLDELKVMGSLENSPLNKKTSPAVESVSE